MKTGLGAQAACKHAGPSTVRCVCSLPALPRSCLCRSGQGDISVAHTRDSNPLNNLNCTPVTF